MNYINRVISRIEKDKSIVIDFDIDEFSKKGSKHKPIGLVRYDNVWYVELEPEAWLGTSETINLVQYMEKTKDIK